MSTRRAAASMVSAAASMVPAPASPAAPADHYNCDATGRGL